MLSITFKLSQLYRKLNIDKKLCNETFCIIPIVLLSQLTTKANSLNNILAILAVQYRKDLIEYGQNNYVFVYEKIIRSIVKTNGTYSKRQLLYLSYF